MVVHYNGKSGHEIVFLFEVSLTEENLSIQDEVAVKEGEENRAARWYSKQDISKCTVLPPQILDSI